MITMVPPDKSLTNAQQAFKNQFVWIDKEWEDLQELREKNNLDQGCPHAPDDLSKLLNLQAWVFSIIKSFGTSLHYTKGTYIFRLNIGNNEFVKTGVLVK